MGTESRQDQLDLTDAHYPSPPVCDRVVEDVLQRRWATREKPPSLGPALRKARELQSRGAVVALDAALVDVAVAALATLTTIRHAVPGLTRRPRR